MSNRISALTVLVCTLLGLGTIVAILNTDAPGFWSALALLVVSMAIPKKFTWVSMNAIRVMLAMVVLLLGVHSLSITELVGKGSGWTPVVKLVTGPDYAEQACLRSKGCYSVTYGERTRITMKPRYCVDPEVHEPAKETWVRVFAYSSHTEKWTDEGTLQLKEGEKLPAAAAYDLVVNDDPKFKDAIREHMDAAGGEIRVYAPTWKSFEDKNGRRVCKTDDGKKYTW